jgi:hypothetical protein
MIVVRFRFIFLVFILLAFAWGCDSSEACLSNQHAVQARFYSAWSDTDKDSVLNNVSLVGEGKIDSIYRNQSISELFMPLDFSSDTTSFVISAETLKDTIRFVHQRELNYISGDCGYIFNFEIDTILHTEAFIDSVSIAYPFVKYGESNENIKLYIY